MIAALQGANETIVADVAKVLKKHPEGNVPLMVLLEDPLLKPRANEVMRTLDAIDALRLGSHSDIFLSASDPVSLERADLEEMSVSRNVVERHVAAAATKGKS